MSISRHCLVWLIILVILACKTNPTRAEGWLTFLLENDTFAGTDREYTAGTELSYYWSRQSTPEFARSFASSALQTDENDSVYAGLALSQSIFTPANKETTQFVPDQQPYAGWLRLEGRVLVRRVSGAEDQLNISLGVVGPEALGRQAQNTIHDVFGFDRVNGWPNQLRFEPTFQAAWERQFSPILLAQSDDRRFVLVPAVGIDAGTVHLQAKTGLTLKWGIFDGAARAPRMTQAFLGTPILETSEEISWFVFAGIDGRAIAHDLFRDGGTLRDGPSVDRKDFVATWTAGWAIAWNNVQLSFSFVDRSREYREQERGHRFGALSISTRY